MSTATGKHVVWFRRSGLAPWSRVSVVEDRAAGEAFVERADSASGAWLLLPAGTSPGSGGCIRPAASIAQHAR